MDEEDLLKKAYDDYEAGAYSPKLLKPNDVDEVRDRRVVYSILDGLTVVFSLSHTHTHTHTRTV